MDDSNGKTGDSSLAGSKRSASDHGDDSADDDGKDDDYDLDPEKRREARKMRRVMANRRSARESRERRKKLLSDLQESVESLTSDNTVLTKENLSLRRELASLIEQSGGAASLSMIPNIQSLLNSTKNLSNLTVPPSASLIKSGGDGSLGEASSTGRK
ncbi:bZIP transcription factor [Nitzschia inconspicua]|uniref:BZIP transcription factor n=1 Tax=Nitzschia inconspicua TaxID=303405 RepID=A0A9K3LZT3_9STRA|nr:bZIP transcription factor [Nitzschia inconspicua]